MSARLRTATVLFAGVLLVSSARPAQAQSTSALAETLFREGKQLLEEASKLSGPAAAAKLDEAIEKFRASDQSDRGVGTRIALGDAYRDRGKVGSAWASYNAARDFALTLSPPDPRAEDALKRAADVAPRVPRLVIRVVQRQSELSVTDNGVAVPPGGLGSSLPVDPGRHEIVATARGRRPFQTKVEIAEGQTQDVAIPLLEWDERTLTPRSEGDRGEPQRTIGTGLLIGGGSVVLVGLVLGGVALWRWSDVKDVCPNPDACPTPAARNAAASDRDAAETFATTSTVVVGTGLVAAAVGLVLRLTAPKATSFTASALGGTGAFMLRFE